MSSRMNRLLRKIDNALFGNLLVLMYHRVHAAAIDPFNICVSPEMFQHHLNILQSMGEVIPASSIARFAGRTPGQGLKFVLTFDDGYQDNFEIALPMLEQDHLPAVFFITANGDSQLPVYYWDVLQSVFLETETLPQRFQCSLRGEIIDVQLGEDAHYPLRRVVEHQGWRLGGKQVPSQRHYWLKTLTYALQDSSALERDEFLLSLSTAAGVDLHPKTALLAGWDTLRGAAKKEICEIGSHSVSHRRLAGLSLPEQEYEITESKIRLERHLGRAVTSFAIPHGGPDDYTPETIACIKNAGYQQAYIVKPSALNHRYDPFRIPRLHIGHWDGVEFQRVLSKVLS